MNYLRHIIAALLLLGSNCDVSNAASPHKPKPVSVEKTVILPNEARELIALVAAADIKGSDAPEVTRLIQKLQFIQGGK